MFNPRMVFFYSMMMVGAIVTGHIAWVIAALVMWVIAEFIIG